MTGSKTGSLFDISEIFLPKELHQKTQIANF